jgi:hypothetical protein
MKQRKKVWLLPLLLLMLMLGAMMFISQGTALAPFIYAIF